MSKTIQMTPVKTETLSPSRFLALSDYDKSNIFQSKIVPPTLGTRNDFGGVKVEYKTPVWKRKD